MRERGEALCESRYRSTKGCCIWLGNIPTEEEKVGLKSVKIGAITVNLSEKN